MKIEKINDNQIKCTLTKNDLVSRKINLTELAYGTDKAKELFSDMMSQAAAEVGFEVEDTPLMIEAIPVSAETLILLVSKVDDPEELDTRFSNFSPFDDEYEEELLDEYADSTDFMNVLDVFEKLKEKIPELAKTTAAILGTAAAVSPDSASQSEENTPAEADKTSIDFVQVFAFTDIDTVCEVGKVLSDTYHGHNVLYKLPDDDNYYLVIHSSDDSIETFNHVCNIMSEYATNVRSANTDEAFYIEHGKVICADNALNKLKDL